MKVEGTEDVTETPENDESKICDATDGTVDSNEIVKTENDERQTESVPDGNNVINNESATNCLENVTETLTKLENTSKDAPDIETPKHKEEQCENLMNNELSEDKKTPFKICRLCLVFVDDSFIPLEKVMVMLQIVLPEVVSVFHKLFTKELISLYLSSSFN